MAVLAVESDIVRDMSFNKVVSKFCHTNAPKELKMGTTHYHLYVLLLSTQ